MNFVKNLSFDKIKYILNKTNICRLASSFEGKVSLAPVYFKNADLDEGKIEFTSHSLGEKIYMIKNNPLVAAEFEYTEDNILYTVVVKGILENIQREKSENIDFRVKMLSVTGKAFEL